MRFHFNVEMPYDPDDPVGSVERALAARQCSNFAMRVHLSMHDHFQDVDTARQRRGDPSLHEELDALLAEHERETGTTTAVLRSQEAVSRVLGKQVELLLQYETLTMRRLIEAERIAYNLGFEHGAFAAKAETLDDPAARELAVEIGELIVRRDADEAAVLRALALLIIGDST